jgi:2-polyprenyl-3-methyl-5-hydroxy-6-metoxy-1,4-benzoquinol methylase
VKTRPNYNEDLAEWAKSQPGFGGQSPDVDGAYNGREELDALTGASRFHAWLAKLVQPVLHGRVLEVGAGIGTVTAALVKQAQDGENVRFLSIEPDRGLAELLFTSVTPLGVEVRHAATPEIVDTGQQFNGVVYINVLEHIEDHVGELQRARALIKPGGRLAIVVPASPRLYGPLDTVSGHYRRYRKQTLNDLLVDAGFTVETLNYFDTAGFFAYWARNTLLGNTRLEKGTVAIFDVLVVPLSKAVYRLAPGLPFGKNLLAIATVAS